MKPPIGQQLQALRLRARKTRAEVAEEARLSERTILNVETHRFPPSLDTLQRIASVFNRTIILSSRAR
jgi:transcriptional regulator with XRE-family HTH domain